MTIPDDVSARIDAALEDEVRAWAEQQRPEQPEPRHEAQVVDFAAAKRRRLRFAWGTGLVGVAAAAVAGIVFSVLPGTPAGPSTQQPNAPGT